MKLLERFKNEDSFFNEVPKYTRNSMVFTTILIIGTLVAVVTGNMGNLFIFLGLTIASHSVFSRDWSEFILNIGRLFYLVGFAWSFTQGGPAAVAGWSSVFATLLIGTYA